MPSDSCACRSSSFLYSHIKVTSSSYSSVRIATLWKSHEIACMTTTKCSAESADRVATRVLLMLGNFWTPCLLASETLANFSHSLCLQVCVVSWVAPHHQHCGATWVTVGRPRVKLEDWEANGGCLLNNTTQSSPIGLGASLKSHLENCFSGCGFEKWKAARSFIYWRIQIIKVV